MVIVLGDLHLSDSRPWSYEVSKGIVDWIKNLPENNSSNTLVLLGDITDKSLVSGKVTELIRELFFSLSFKETYICMGNHEGEIRGNSIALTYDFIENVSTLSTKITIVRTYGEYIIDGLTTLFLPHIYNHNGHSLEDYATLPDQIKFKEYDVLFGHITDSRIEIPTNDKIDISHLKTKYLMLGHIHNGEFPGYLGSVVPNSVSENDAKRYMGIINNQNGEISVTKKELDHKLLCYKEVDYPEAPSRSSYKTVVWTVNNAQDPDVVRVFYKRPDMYIRKCSYIPSIDSQDFSTVTNAKEVSFLSFLADFLDEKDKMNLDLKEKITYYGKTYYSLT